MSEQDLSLMSRKALVIMEVTNKPEVREAVAAELSRRDAITLSQQENDDGEEA